jgi:hypothetical protein
VKHSVDFLELVSVFDRTNALCEALYDAAKSLFDLADDFKPQFETDNFSSRIQRKNISYFAFITDGNKNTNSTSTFDFRYLGCTCHIWIFDDLFRANIEFYGYKGMKWTSTDSKKTFFTDLEISESNWSDLYKNLSSEFQQISLGRPLLQFLLHDFYSEDRYEQFKKVVIEKLQEHSLAHLIQP